MASPGRIGGKLVTRNFQVLALVWAVATAVIAVRFTRGLGAATAMNDGYPWGLWIVLDVVVGTALASGGYAMALIVYVLNKGRYHPLVRPALLTSALGYTVAGVAVFFDLGRYWNLWMVPVKIWRWNLSSALLEVALCMLAYAAVVWIEVSPAFLEKLRDGPHPALARYARRTLPALERALPFVLAAGLVLPTMHQSTLGSLLLVAGSKLHGLWHTPLLPLLFLLTSFTLGYAIIVVEALFSSVNFGRPVEMRLLHPLGRVVAAISLAWVAVRGVDLAAAGKVDLALTPGWPAVFFMLEVLTTLVAAVLLTSDSARSSPGRLLQGAGMVLVAGALYRVDVFLVGFDPGRNFAYFPSVGEIAVSLGLIATETMVYLFVVKNFPILAGVVHAPARRAAAPAEDVARAG